MSSNESNSVSTAAPNGERIFFGQFDVTNQVSPFSYSSLHSNPQLFEPRENKINKNLNHN